MKKFLKRITFNRLMIGLTTIFSLGLLMAQLNSINLQYNPIINVEKPKLVNAFIEAFDGIGTCTWSVRIKNKGSISEEISGINMRVSFIHGNRTSGNFYFPYAQIKNPFSGIKSYSMDKITSMQIYITPIETEKEIKENFFMVENIDNLIDLPIVIPANGEISILVSTVVSYDFLSFPYGIRYFFDDNPYDDDYSIQDKKIPLLIRLDLITDNKPITINDLSCWGIPKEYPVVTPYR